MKIVHKSLINGQTEENKANPQVWFFIHFLMKNQNFEKMKDVLVSLLSGSQDLQDSRVFLDKSVKRLQVFLLPSIRTLTTLSVLLPDQNQGRELLPERVQPDGVVQPRGVSAGQQSVRHHQGGERSASSSSPDRVYDPTRLEV